VDYRIKPHVPPFVQIPAMSIKFQTTINKTFTTQAEYLRVSLNNSKVFSTHMSQYGLLG